MISNDTVYILHVWSSSGMDRDVYDTVYETSCQAALGICDLWEKMIECGDVPKDIPYEDRSGVDDDGHLILICDPQIDDPGDDEPCFEISMKPVKFEYQQ